jgi:DNA-binding Lrp family transcriptional regulator
MASQERIARKRRLLNDLRDKAREIERKEDDLLRIMRDLREDDLASLREIAAVVKCSPRTVTNRLAAAEGGIR